MRQMALLVLLLLVMTQGTAHAYLDPGTGSLVLQFLAGAVFLGVMMVKGFWHRIIGGARSLLGLKSDGKSSDDASE